MIHFIGMSFAAQHLKAAAIKRGLSITDDLEQASLVFVSEDTPTNERVRGTR
jgi:fructose-specific component phosphotransferase system IIB-like protein